MNEQLKIIFDGVINGDQKTVVAGVQAALAAGVDAACILNEGMIPAMSQVGNFFECGEYFVPEMLIAARAMKSGLQILRPALIAANVQAIGKVVIGTVQGDLHDIGKNLVAMMLEGAGFEVIDLGVDVPPQKFVDAIQQHQPNFVGMSALLTTTMPKMKITMDAIQTASLRAQTKIMIGGAPVTLRYAQEIGADIFAPDAGTAARLAKQALT